jgi:undecaprenyl pyrophosphate phosphatase UppP
MHFGAMVSLVIAIAAVVGVFAYIPYISDYAFWVLVVALLVWELGRDHNAKLRFRFWLMVAIALLIVAIVGLLTDIPIISTYPFWILAAAYLVVVGNTRMFKEKK